jgi:hypothetical protein
MEESSKYVNYKFESSNFELSNVDFDF